MLSAGVEMEGEISATNEVVVALLLIYIGTRAKGRRLTVNLVVRGSVGAGLRVRKGAGVRS